MNTPTRPRQVMHAVPNTSMRASPGVADLPGARKQNMEDSTMRVRGLLCQHCNTWLEAHDRSGWNRSKRKLARTSSWSWPRASAATRSPACTLRVASL
jgi:hypothetical protein